MQNKNVSKNNADDPNSEFQKIHLPPGMRMVRDEDLGIDLIERIPKEQKPGSNFSPGTVSGGSGSLDQANDELSDAYMNFKDLAGRCTVEFQNLQSNGLFDSEDQNEDQGGHEKKMPNFTKKKKKTTKVFYFKPDTFLLEDPDKQRIFREKLMTRLKQTPTLERQQLMAQDLAEQRILTVADRSQPYEIRKLLAEYFQRRHYSLQHKKYKILLRWAHHAIKTRNIEVLGTQATFRISKIQWEIDNAIKRGQRLSVDDDFKRALDPESRPSSKTKEGNGSSLYVEMKDLPPQSCVRYDDVEVYLRHITYSQKINKLVNKFMARLKWLPLQRRFDIFESMIHKYFWLRQQNIEKQQKFWDNLETHTRAIHVQNQQLNDEIKEIKSRAHILNYQASIQEEKLKLLSSCRPDYDVVPDLIRNNPELKIRIKSFADIYGLTANLDQDNGFSFAYQLTLFFPTHFQKMVVKSTFSIYDAFAGKNSDQAALHQRKLQNMVRVDPNMFKDIATNSNFIPSDESLAEEVVRMNIKIIRLKASQWIQYVSVLPTIQDWQRSQDAVLSSEENPIDQLLSGQMDFLDVNDLASVNLVLQESAQIHSDIIKRQKALELQYEYQTRVGVKLQVGGKVESSADTDEQHTSHKIDGLETTKVYQTVSAISIQELNNNLYVHLTNSLTGQNLSQKILEDQQKRQNNLKDLKESELIAPGLLKIEPNLVQSLNTLRYIYGREAKTRILYCLNYFRAIQKRLMLDLREASTRERVLGDVPDPLIMPEEADSQITDTYNMVLANANLGIHLADKGKIDDLNDDEVMIGKTGPPPGFQSGSAKLQRKMTRHHTKVQSTLLNKSNQPMDQATEVELILQKKKMLQESMSKEIKEQGKLQISSQQHQKEQDSFSLIDIKKTRYKGHFHEKHLSTCPVLPRFHATFGEPSEITGKFVDFDREQREEPISKDSLKLLGRVDHIEIDPVRKEVFVKDDFNIYIIYECVLSDMQILEQEILRIGSYFITRLEDLYDTEVDKVSHKKDRQQVLTDLLECEADFQFKKVILAQVFMDAYEHICDPVEQQRVTKIVIDLCARRPRLSLDSCFYFKDAYTAEIECIEKQIDLFQIVMENQIKLEKQENSHLHEALNLSYNLAQMKMRDGWQYNNPDDYLTHLIEVFNSKALTGKIKLNMEDDDELGSGTSKFDAGLKSGFGNKDSEGNKNKSLSDDEGISNNQNNQGSNNREKKRSSSQLKLQQKVTELKAIEMRYNEQDLDQDAFTRLLGLPKVTIENLFAQVKERDEMILDIMNEHSHFVNLIEGYPDLMSLRHSGNRIFASPSEEELVGRPNYVNPDAVHEYNLKFNQVSTRAQEVSILDFFSDALLFVSKLNSTLVSCYQELHEALRPHDNTLACLLETEIYVQAIRQYREMQMYLSGERIEFKGQQYIQDEMVLGSADKMMFYMKDLHSSFNRQMKSTLNPFIVAKLDLTSIKAYKFIANVDKQDNPYLQKRSLLTQGKEVSLAIAEHKFLHNHQDFQTEFVQSHDEEQKEQNQNLQNKVSGQEDKGKLKVKPPGMLTLACNSIELLRLRSELILCVSECVELQKIYDQQVLVCKRQNMKANYQEGLAFEHGILRKNEVNYVDDGPASMLEIGLAISEIDPVITSNLNFRNPDAFKMLITTSGLEELRCALHYQLMQKQALIVATRINQSLMDIHLRAIKELRLVKMGFVIPNMVIQVDDLFKNTLSEGMSDHEFDLIQQKFLSNLYTKVASCLVSVNAWKNEQRTNLTKKFQDMLVFIDKNYPQREVKLRVLRHYKVCLFNQYVNQILSQIYQDSVKYNLINQVQKLRRINSYFQFNPSSMNIVPIDSAQKDPKKKTPEELIDCYYSILFNLETNDLLENLSAWYQLEKYQQQATRIMHYEDSKQKKNLPSGDSEYMEISNNRDTKFQSSNFLAIDFKKGIQHLDSFVLPSSTTLIQLPSSESLFPRPSFEIIEQKKFLNDNVEGELIFSQILPKLSDIENFEKIYPFEKLKLTKILRYYSMIENIINIELSILKFQFSSKVITEMDNSIQYGMPFFISRSANLNQKSSQSRQESHQSDFKDHLIPATGLLAIINSGKAVDEISLTSLGKKLNKEARELENTSHSKQAKKNLMTAKIVKYLYQKTKLKADIGEELQQIAIRIKEVMSESKRHAEKKFQLQNDQNQENKLLQTSFDLEYLELYQEIRYLQIISTIQRVGDYFQQKKYLKAAQAVNDTILSISKRDHIRIILTNGSAHVNSSDIDSHRIRIDPSSLCPFFGDYYEGNNFQKCVFPVLSDKALEPPEMTMLESIYIGNSEIDFIKKEIIVETQTDNEKKPKKSSLLNKQGGSANDQNLIVQRRTGQFVGAAVPTQPFISTNFQPFQTYLLCIDKVQRDYLSQNLKLMDDLLNDFLQIVANENLEDSTVLPKFKLLNFSQLQTSRRFLSEQIECRQLKTGILCFLGHELPSRLIQNERVINYLNSIFKKNLLWKILMEKDIQRDYMDDRYKTKYQREELRRRKLEIEQEIIQLQKVDERKITDVEVSKVTNLQIQALQNEHKYMRFNMLLDQILFERASKVVIQQEIEIHLIKAAVRTLDAECIAIANCLKNQSKEIEAHIHPFQQFSVTLYDRVDPLSHLDPINKISFIQQFLTRLKNRGTEVETLTSGPGYVFTLKDINDCVGTLTKGLLKFSEIEMRQRCELFSKREQHYLNLLYIKDQEINQLDNRINQQSKSVDKIVNSRLLEKGNQIVFELDQTSRTLRMFKDHINMFETEVRRQIDGEFKNKMLYLESQLALKSQEFIQFRKDQTNTLLEKLTKDTDVLEPYFNKRKLQYQTADQTPAKYQLPRETDKKLDQPVEKVKKGLMPRGSKPEPAKLSLLSVNNSQNNEPSQKLIDLQQFVENPPEKSNVVFMYDEQSSNDNPQIRLPKQLQQVYDYTEAQARQELAQIHKYTIKSFYFNKMKEVIIRQKFETELQTLQKMVSNNQLLNQKMAESQKRESILRQELMLTQEALSVAERTRDKQKEEIVKLETEKMRLLNFKQQKSKRLDELEQQATKYEIFQKIDMDKLIQVLYKQQTELKNLRTDKSIFEAEIQNTILKNKEELKNIQQKARAESKVKQDAMDKLGHMRTEMQALEVSKGSATELWKRKFYEALDICQELKEQNEYLTQKSQELAEVSMNLLVTFHQNQITPMTQSNHDQNNDSRTFSQRDDVRSAEKSQNELKSNNYGSLGLLDGQNLNELSKKIESVVQSTRMNDPFNKQRILLGQKIGQPLQSQSAYIGVKRDGKSRDGQRRGHSLLKAVQAQMNEESTRNYFRQSANLFPSANMDNPLSKAGLDTTNAVSGDFISSYGKSTGIGFPAKLKLDSNVNQNSNLTIVGSRQQIAKSVGRDLKAQISNLVQSSDANIFKGQDIFQKKPPSKMADIINQQQAHPDLIISPNEERKRSSIMNANLRANKF